MKQTKRKSIKSISEVSNTQFISDMLSLKDSFIEVSEKVDGMGFRFGKYDGQCYVESSYSKPIFKHESFVERNVADNKPVSVYTKSLDKIKNIFYNYNIFEYINFDNYKVLCEILYEDDDIELEKDKENITFVKTKYQRNNLGRVLTIYIINVLDLDNNTHIEKDDIIKELIKKSNENIKIVYSSIKINPILFCSMTHKINMFDTIFDIETTLKTKNNIKKNIVNMFIHNIKINFIKKIINNIDFNTLLSNNPEGFVLLINKTNCYKIKRDEYERFRKL